MTAAKETNRVRVKLEFVIHLDRGVDAIPFTREGFIMKWGPWQRPLLIEAAIGRKGVSRG